MTTVQIKDVPEETHVVLRRRAAEAHQSLQEYLRSWLIAETSRPTVDEVLARIGTRTGARSRSLLRPLRCEPTVIVVDASVLVTTLADDGRDGARARDRLAGCELAAPELIDLEVTSALRRLVDAKRLAVRRAELALADLLDLPLRRCAHGPLLRRCWQLRRNVSIYDGAYVALAEVLDAVLLTADLRLSRAPGLGCSVEILGPA